MADRKVSQLTALGAAPALTDYFFFIDISEASDDDKNKRVTFQNVFGLLSVGDGFDVTVGSGKTLDLQNAGTIYVNEAVALTATSSELNAVSSGDMTDAQHDHTDVANGGLINTLSVGNTSVVVTDPGTGVVTVTCDATTVAEFGAVDTKLYDGGVQVFQTHYSAATNAGFDVHNDAGATHLVVRATAGGNVTLSNSIDSSLFTFLGNDSGSVQRNLARWDANGPLRFYHQGTEVLTTTATGFTSLPDNGTAVMAIGPAQIGYDGTNSDTAHFAHYDHMSSTNYALRQSNLGNTIVNAVTGQTVSFRINNSSLGNISSTGLTLTAGTLIARADTDTTHEFGRAKIGFNGSGSDDASFAHYDNMTLTNNALRQSATGATWVNAVTGQSIAFTINNSQVFSIGSSGLIGSAGGVAIDRFDDDDTLAADSSSRVATQAATKGYVDGRTRSITIPVFDAVTAVTTGEKGIVVVTPDLNGLNLTNVIVGVWDKGVTGSTDVGIYRSRAGTEVAVLSTEVTVGDEWFAQDGVINTANDDMATGDILNVNISAIHTGTAPNGLTVTLEFS